MNEVISKEVVVLYRIENDYGWRWAHEFLPKNVELVSMIGVVNGQATAVRYGDPKRIASPNAPHFDEIVTAIIAQKMEKGTFAVWATRSDDYRKRDVAQNVANLIGDLYDVASMSMALLALDAENIVSYLETTTDEAMAATVVTTLRAAELADLEDHVEVCELMLRTLPQRWRLQLFLTRIPEVWNFWSGTLIAVFPTEG
jgi:hypothetical protein